MITDKSTGSMLAVPLVLHIGRFFPVTDATPGRDLPASQDPLPAALGNDAAGYVLSRETRVTEVRRETTEEN